MFGGNSCLHLVSRAGFCGFKLINVFIWSELGLRGLEFA